MAEVHIVDIDGEQWDIKDLPLTTKVTDLEKDINSSNEYSTKEVITGKKWIDGKNIYRKAFVPLNIVYGDVYVPIASGDWVNKIKLITNAIIINGSVTITTGRYYRAENTLYYNLGFLYSGEQTNAYAIIEYTKNTD